MSVSRRACLALFLLATVLPAHTTERPAALSRSAGLTLSLPDTVGGCTMTVGVLSLRPAPAGATVVRLRSTHGLLEAPPLVVLPPGVSSAYIPLSAGAVRVPTRAWLTASGGKHTASASLIVTPTEPPAYTMEALGTLGGAWSAAAAIGPSGQVAGVSETADGRVHAFRTRPDGTLENIDPDNPDAVVAAAINGAGQVAGWVRSASGVRAAFVTGPGGALELLQVPGAASSRTTALNAAGEAAGFLVTPEGLGRAFRVDASGHVSDLGVFANGTNSYAYGLTDDGQAAGFADDGNRVYAFRTRPGGNLLNAAKIGSHTLGYAVSALGQVAGEVYNPDDGYFHAFRSRPDGTAQDLGTLGRHDAAAYGINRQGDVVGGTYLLGGPVHHAFLYTDTGGLRDLNDLIPPRSGWILQAATGINDRGEIAGYGLHNGARRAFRLVPTVPDLPYGDVDASGTVDAGDAARLLRVAGGLAPVDDIRIADTAPAPSCAPRGFGDGVAGVADAVRALRRRGGREPVWP